MPRVRRSVRIGGVTLAVAAAVGGGLAVTAGSGGSSSPGATAVAVIRPAPMPPPPSHLRAKPALDTRSTVVAAPAGVRVYDRPDGRRVVRTLSGRTDLGAVQTLLTVSEQGGWWKVALPVRPNDATGWVRKADVHASTIDALIEVDRKAHRLTFLTKGKVAHRYPVAVGTAATPTPAGRFYVTDNLSTGNPGGAYGPYALGLSGHSDVLMTFGSGDGVLGIHGTDEAASIGTDASHGCIRLRNADITALRAVVPLGTPVLVR